MEMELNNTVWELLQTIQWSYAALWSLTRDRRTLKWQEGWFNLKAAAEEEGQIHNKNAELFYFLYNPLTFAPGVGYAGHALQNMGGGMLWLAGDLALRSIPNPLEKQSLFIKAAGIQTTICVPFQDKVLELGTTNMVVETEELAHCIKKVLFSLLDRYMKKPQLYPFPDLAFGAPTSHNPQTPAAAAAEAEAPSPISTLPSKQMNMLSLPPSSSSPFDEEDMAYMVPPVATEMPWTSAAAADMGLDVWGSSTLQQQQQQQHSCFMDHIGLGIDQSFSLPLPFMDSSSLLEPTRGDRSSSLSSQPAQIEDTEISSVAEGRECESSWVFAPAQQQQQSHRSPSSPDSSTCGSPKPKPPPPPAAAPGMKQKGGRSEQPSSSQRQRLERQSSSSLAPESTPVLVQLGNVLQLGNASGQVAEALPVEHDEAAVSHMLAERRRRIKQNENFSRLKALIPSAAKMDKASVLAETIVYINTLKARLDTLEQCNESLKFLMAGTDLMAPTTPSPPKPSSPELDRVDVSPEGDANLRIEVRNPCCSQAETAIQILALLKQMQLNVISSQISLDDNRIRATFVVKMKRKNSNGQSEVCASLKSQLRRCLGLCY